MTVISRRVPSVLNALLFGVACASALLPQNIRAEKQGDCGYPAVNVIYDDSAELASACDALVDVIGHFRRSGFEVVPKLSLRFVDHAAGSLEHGHFNVDRSEIVISRTSDVSPWGLPWSSKLAAAFLRHELAHMAMWQVLSVTHARLGREWHEFVAYVIQLDLMDDELRSALLARYPQAHAIRYLEEVNEFTYGMNPQVFAVVAYKTYLARGGSNFLGQILRGEVSPPIFSYPFPVLKN